MKELLQNKNTKWFALALEFILYVILFIYKRTIHFDLLSHFLMGMIIVVNWYYFFYKAIDKIKFSKASFLFLLIINLMISFFVSGKYLFFNNNGAIAISLIAVLAYLAVNIFVFPFVYNFVYILEKADIKSTKKNKDVKAFAFKVFAITFLCWLIMSLAYYPGGLSSDSTSQIAQALGIYRIDNGHPALCTILIKILMTIWKSPFVVVVANTFFFSVILTYIYKYLYEQNINVKFLYISLFAFIFSVNNITMITMLWKDIPFTISLLWLTFEVYKITKYKDNYFKKNKNIIIFCFAMVLTYFFRHNGMVPFLMIILYLLYLLIKSSVRFRIILSIVLCFGMVWFIKGPVYDYYNVDKSDVMVGGSASFAVKGLGSLIYYGAEIDEEDIEDFNTLTSDENFKKYYNPYSLDEYAFNDTGINAGIDKLGLPKIYQLYIKYFFKRPDIIIRDKLDGCNLLWSYQTPDDGFNYKYEVGISYPDWIEDFEGFERNDGDKYISKTNILRETISVYQKGTGVVVLADIFFWRCGFVLSILVILVYFVIWKKIKIFPAFFPTLINILFWVALMNHQDYRYLWFIYVNTFFLIILSLMEKKKTKK